MCFKRKRLVDCSLTCHAGLATALPLHGSVSHGPFRHSTVYCQLLQGVPCQVVVGLASRVGVGCLFVSVDTNACWLCGKRAESWVLQVQVYLYVPGRDAWAHATQFVFFFFIQSSTAGLGSFWAQFLVSLLLRMCPSCVAGAHVTCMVCRCDTRCPGLDAHGCMDSSHCGSCFICRFDFDLKSLPAITVCLADALFLTMRMLSTGWLCWRAAQLCGLFFRACCQM